MTTKITTPGGGKSVLKTVGKPVPDIAALARAHTAEGIEVLATLTLTGETAAVRALAAGALRARGISVSYVDVTGAAR